MRVAALLLLGSIFSLLASDKQFAVLTCVVIAGLFWLAALVQMFHNNSRRNNNVRT